VSSASVPPPLVLGATAPVGRALLRRLAGTPVVAAVRRPPSDGAFDEAGTVDWRAADLYALGPDLAPGSAVLAAGPLDALVTWLEREDPRPSRVVALSSTSVHVKAASVEPTERGLVARLLAAEAGLAAWADARGVPWTVLRPTLIYDDTSPGALDVFVRTARRFRVVLLPDDAVGLRQPVHADDVAQAMLACMARAHTASNRYDLPGGETLGYRRLVERTLVHAGVAPRIITVPRPLLVAGLAAAHAMGRMRAYGPAMLARMADDLCFDAAAARRDFGWAPRPYPGR
jgi:nucleoside-diphosphate-sugar epimerase